MLVVFISLTLASGRPDPSTSSLKSYKNMLYYMIWPLYQMRYGVFESFNGHQIGGQLTHNGLNLQQEIYSRPI